MTNSYLRGSLRVFSLAVCIMLATDASADMAPTEFAQVDWKAAIAAYKSQAGDNLEALRGIRTIKDQVTRRRPIDGLGTDTQQDLATINALVSPIRPKIASAGSPVLLPFDVKRLSDDFLRTGSPRGAESTSVYFGRFKSLAFHPGPYGYRAYLGLENRSTVMISGSSIFYKLPGNPALPALKSCTDFVADAKKAGSNEDARKAFFADLARYERKIGEVQAQNFSETEASIPCMFAGALVEVNILCDAVGDPDCKVESLAQQIIASLTFVGGAPRSGRASSDDPIRQLAKEVSSLMRAVKESSAQLPPYGEPGDIIPSSGVMGKGGSKDTNIYGPILFPTAPSASAQTVVYRNDEGCQEGEANAPTICKTRGPNDTELTIVKSKPGEWRDNFCEKRSNGSLPTCPEGKGHAGQDIWGQGRGWNDSTAKHPLRAVVDAIAFRRFPTQPAVTLSDVNASNIDYIYRHMRPSELDKTVAAATAQAVKRGCTLAPVDRLQAVEKNGPLIDGNVHFGATARHLHFEIRVPTRAGYQNVSPYQTVVQAHRASVSGVDKSTAVVGPCIRS